MIKYEQALDIIKNNTELLDSESVNFMDSIKRVLHQDIYSDIDMPPFNKSAMDGYACKKEDIFNELEIIEIIPAGYEPKQKVGKNQCSKIMTGAKIPEGADCVIIIEQSQETNNKVKFLGDKTSENICYKGEDVKENTLVMSKGKLISTKDIGTLAMIGATNILVARKPSIGIIATGDELVEPTIKPYGSTIRNSNSYQIIAQTIDAGCNYNYYGIVKDDNLSIKNVILKAKEENDLVVLTGGVSMGDFDYVPAILKEVGYELLFEKVAIQPGKPTVFGKDKNKYVFGLPGNPVSSYLIYEIFVKYFLKALTGNNTLDRIIKLPLADNIKRKKTERLGWIPIIINDKGKVEKLEYHGSAHINSLSQADGIISFPVGVKELEKGTLVDVRQL